MNRLLDIIDRAYPGLSKGHKLIAQFIRAHYDRAAFMTASVLGDAVGVSESTVVRFAAELGFDGYAQLQKALQEIIRNRLTSVQRMAVTHEKLAGKDVLTKILHADADAIKRTLEITDRAVFAAAVADIIAANKIYIMGVRSSSALAGFLSYYFRHIFDDARNIDTASTSMIFEQLMRIGPGDVFIAITFSRYSRRTCMAADFARMRGAKLITITDSLVAPAAEIADHVIVARSDMASFVDSLVAPLSVINALIVAIGLEKSTEVEANYIMLEQIWDEYSVYEKSGEGAD